MARKKSLAKALLKSAEKSARKYVAKQAAQKRTNGWRYKSGAMPPQRAFVPDVEPFVIPEGKFEQHVYIYDGRPLKGTRKGSRFMVDFTVGMRTMTSVYTETMWTSNHCIAYNNQLIGHISDGTIADHLIELTRRYKRVSIHAKRFDTSPGGWPLIELLVPYSAKGDPEKDWLQLTT